MAVRVFDIPGLQGTQINAAKMDPRAAGAPFAALGELGEAIAGISKPFAQIAGDLQHTENLRQQSELRTALDTQLTDFRIEIEKDPDPVSRMKRMDDFLAKSKSILDRPGLSPAVRNSMIGYHDQWASNARNQNALQAADLSQRRASQAFKNEQIAAFENNDIGRLRLAHNDAVAAGAALPEEWKGIEHDFNEKQRRDTAVRSIYENPAAFLDSNASPPEGGNLVEWENNRDLARQLLRRENVEATDKFQDMLSLGQITTPEQIDELFWDQRPAVIESYKADLAQRGDAAFKARAATPEYQDEVIGQVTSMLDSYRVDSDNFDEQFARMDSMVRSLPEGSGAKAELSRQMDRVRNGQIKTMESVADMARQSFVDVYKAQFFGTTLRRQSTQSAIDAGLLRDREKLKQAGFTDESLDYITGRDKDGKPTDKAAEKLSDTDRLGRFRERYPQRIDKKTTKDPYLQRAFDAMQAGEGKVEWEDPEAKKTAERNLGEAIRKFDEWATLNPAKAKDDKEVMAKTYQLIAPFGVDNFKKALIPPVPQELPPTGKLPEIPRDEAMDWPPGVLPPLGF
jgi:hypothetical protein